MTKIKELSKLFQQDVSRDAVLTQERARVNNFLAQGLTEKQRFYLMEYFNGKRFAQIARENNVTASTVSRTAYLAYNKLVKFLKMARVDD